MSTQYSISVERGGGCITFEYQPGGYLDAHITQGDQVTVLKNLPYQDFRIMLVVMQDEHIRDLTQETSRS